MISMKRTFKVIASGAALALALSLAVPVVSASASTAAPTTVTRVHPPHPSRGQLQNLVRQHRHHSPYKNQQALIRAVNELLSLNWLNLNTSQLFSLMQIVSTAPAAFGDPSGVLSGAWLVRVGMFLSPQELGNSDSPKPAPKPGQGCNGAPAGFVCLGGSN